MLKASAAAVTAVVIFRIDPSFSFPIRVVGPRDAYVASLRSCSSANARTFSAGSFPLMLSSPPLSVLGLLADRPFPGGTWHPGVVPVSDTLWDGTRAWVSRRGRFVP